MANVNQIVNIAIDRVAQQMTVIISFTENSTNPPRFRGMRSYLFTPVAGVLQVFDDSPPQPTRLPDAQAGLKNAVVGGGATNGLLPELNTYFTTNSASIVL